MNDALIGPAAISKLNWSLKIFNWFQHGCCLHGSFHGSRSIFFPSRTIWRIHWTGLSKSTFFDQRLFQYFGLLSHGGLWNEHDKLMRAALSSVSGGHFLLLLVLVFLYYCHFISIHRTMSFDNRSNRESNNWYLLTNKKKHICNGHTTNPQRYPSSPLNAYTFFSIHFSPYSNDLVLVRYEFEQSFSHQTISVDMNYVLQEFYWALVWYWHFHSKMDRQIMVSLSLWPKYRLIQIYQIFGIPNVQITSLNW